MKYVIEKCEPYYRQKFRELIPLKYITLTKYPIYKNIKNSVRFTHQLSIVLTYAEVNPPDKTRQCTFCDKVLKEN